MPAPPVTIVRQHCRENGDKDIAYASLTHDITFHAEACQGPSFCLKVVRHWWRRRGQGSLRAIRQRHEGERSGTEFVAVCHLDVVWCSGESTLMWQSHSGVSRRD